MNSAKTERVNGQAKESAPAVVVEKGKRLSQSFVWGTSRRYYEKTGIDAWRSGVVPHYVTSNPFIARAYARMILAWLRDCRSAGAIDPAHPVYVVEIGAGSGRFSFYLLKALTALLPQAALEGIRVKYVMADLVEQNIAFWRQHPALKPFVAAGQLDFARFNAIEDSELALLESGEKLAPGTVKNPIGLIANYILDSLPQDVFFVRGGKLFESTVVISSSQPEPDLEDPAMLERLRLSYDATELAASPYYEDEVWDGILQHYRGTLDHTAVLFPCGPIQCITRLAALSGGRMLVLSADKGQSREEALLHTHEVGMALHGSISFSVNYHAIGEWARSRGGRFLKSEHRHTSLSIGAVLLGPGAEPGSETSLTFEERLANLSPDDFFAVTRAVESAELTLELVLAYVRFSGWDPALLARHVRGILPEVEAASLDAKRELYWLVRQVWENYYHVGDRPDVPFLLGLLLCKMGYEDEGITLLEQSLRLFGEDAGTHYNIGMARYHQHHLDHALAAFRRSQDLDTQGANGARGMCLQIEAELARLKRHGLAEDVGQTLGPR